MMLIFSSKLQFLGGYGGYTTNLREEYRQHEQPMTKTTYDKNDSRDDSKNDSNVSHDTLIEATCLRWYLRGALAKEICPIGYPYSLACLFGSGTCSMNILEAIEMALLS